MIFRPWTAEEYSDTQLFRKIYHKHQRAMYGYALLLLPDRPDLADDVMQEAFLTVSRKIDVFAELTDGEIRVYLEKIVRSKVRELMRTEGPLQSAQVSYEEMEDELPAADEDLLEQLCQKEDFQRLTAILRAMPEKYRDLLELYYLNQWNLKEIARALDQNYEAVRKRFRRAKTMLMEELQKRGYGDGHDDRTKKRE